MSGHKGLVGRGYMPKGGVPAAQAHNQRVRDRDGARGSVPAAVLPVVQVDARASASADWASGVRLWAAAAGLGWVAALVGVTPWHLMGLG